MSEHNNIAYFLTFGVMTEGANPMGHSFVMVSQLDFSKGEAAKIEVMNAIGFYSEYMSVLGFKPISRGKILSEDARYIVNRNGLYHKTFHVTQADVDTFLTNLFKIKALLDKHKNKPCSCENLPTFNIFKKKNCKQFMLREMEKIGIDTSDLSSPFETPRMIDSLHPFTIQNTGEDYDWRSPMPFEIKQSTQPSSEILQLQTRQKALQQARLSIQRAIYLIEQRQKFLHKLNKKSPVIDKLHQQLTKTLEEMTHKAQFPLSVNRNCISVWQADVKSYTSAGLTALKNKGVNDSLFALLVDTLQECIEVLAVCIASPEKQLLQTNSRDRWIVAEVQSLTRAVRI